MRVLFFGMLGTLTRLPLAAMLAADLDLCGLVLPAEIVPPFELVGNGRSSSPLTPIRPQPPALNLLLTGHAPSPLALATAHSVPAFAVRQLAAPETVAALAALQPDLIWRPLLSAPAAARHSQAAPAGPPERAPSLLPRFRGPAPLFWRCGRAWPRRCDGAFYGRAV
ncbi:MAG: hypothetical protein R3D55_21325 [Chloroflexota bacterium]